MSTIAINTATFQINTVMLFLDYLPQCHVELKTCISLRAGLTVNWLFFALGILILVLIHIALIPPTQVGIKVKSELHGQLVHIGYSMYLAAGCAFFGAWTFSEWLLINHMLFAAIWSLGLIFLLFLEYFRARFSDSRGEFSISRMLAIPTAICMNAWVWSGAGWVWTS